METLERTYKVPSNGLFGGPLEVTLRPLTTKEEKMLYTSRDETFLNKIVKSCVVEPKDFDLRKLHPNDITYLLYMLRELTFGEKYKQKVVCQECGEKQDTEINITEMTFNVLELDELEEKLKVELPINGDIIQLQLLSQGDFDDIDNTIKKLKRQDRLQDPEGYEYVYKFAKMVKTINGETQENIKDTINYIEDLNMRDFAEIKLALSQIPLGIDTTNIRTCKKCGEEMEVIGAIVPEFFCPYKS